MEAIRGGWYLGEQGFKDKFLGLIDKAGARIRDRGNLAGAPVRVQDEKEAERSSESLVQKWNCQEARQNLSC